MDVTRLCMQGEVGGSSYTQLISCGVQDPSLRNAALGTRRSVGVHSAFHNIFHSIQMLLQQYTFI